MEIDTSKSSVRTGGISCTWPVCDLLPCLQHIQLLKKCTKQFMLIQMLGKSRRNTLGIYRHSKYVRHFVKFWYETILVKNEY